MPGRVIFTVEILVELGRVIPPLSMMSPKIFEESDATLIEKFQPPLLHRFRLPPLQVSLGGGPGEPFLFQKKGFPRKLFLIFSLRQLDR
jgi:hypothetical protein